MAVSQPLRNCGITLGIDIIEDEPVFGMNSQRLQLKPPEITGRARIEVALPRLAFGEGDYAFNANILNSAGIEMDRKMHASLITVRSDDMKTGYVKVLPRVSVRQDRFL